MGESLQGRGVSALCELVDINRNVFRAVMNITGVKAVKPGFGKIYPGVYTPAYGIF